MNKATTLLIAGTLLATSVIGFAEKVEADIDGATVGKWTMDFEAAKTLAAEKKVPILLDFSGSDWCGWCKVMEENVFTKPEWTAYATNHLVMVLLDFPNDKTLVPEKYVARNQALQAKYDVQGFPAFILLDEDGETELGRLSSGQEKTPASFQKELAGLFRNRPTERAKYTALLSPEARVEFESINTQIADLKAARKTADAEAVAATLRVTELAESIGKQKEALREFRAKQLGDVPYKEYQELKSSFESKRKELEGWIEMQPERTEENMAKFQAMQSELQSIESKLEAY